MTTLALGVVAFHDAPALERLLASATGFDEVLVANVEHDAAVAAVAERYGVEAVPVDGNPGYAAAVGALAAVASASHLLFTNDDIVFLPGATDGFRAAARHHTVVLPRLVALDGRTVGSVRALPTPGRALLELVLLPDEGPHLRCVAKWRRPPAVEAVDAATAAAVLVDRDVLLQHPLPTGYFLYWEEISWFWTLRDHGIAVVLDPSIAVVHAGATAAVSDLKMRQLGANLVRLGEERYGRPGRWGYALLAALWMLRLAVTDIVRRDRRRRWSARRAGLAGAARAALGAA